MFRNGFGIFVVKVIMLFLSFSVNAIIAHYVSPTDFGRYILIFSLVNLSILVCQLGLNQLVVKEVALIHVAQGKGEAVKFSAKAIITVTVIALFYSSMILLFLGDFANKYLFNSLLGDINFIWVGLWVLLGSLVSMFAETLRGFKQVVVATSLASPIQFLALLLLLLLLPGGNSLNTLLFLIVVSFIVALMFALFYSRRFVSLAVTNPIGTSFSGMNRGMPFLVAAFLVMVFDQVDIWIMGGLTNPEDIALYGAAQRLVRLAMFSLVIINALIPPFVSELYEQGKVGQLNKLVKETTSLAAIPSILVLLTYIFFGDRLLSLVYGGSYESAWSILVILTIGQVVNVGTGAGMILLTMTGHQRDLLAECFLALIIKVPIIISLLLNGWGVVEVALVSSFMLIVFNLRIAFLCKKLIGVFPMLSFNIVYYKRLLKIAVNKLLIR